MAQAHRFSGKGQPYEGLTRIINGRPQWVAKVRCIPEMLELPLHWTRPRRIFVNSMSDLFHEDVPDHFITDVFRVMARAHWHTFLVLTKRPERMRDYMGSDSALEFDQAGEDRTFREENAAWPLPNVWLGVSVEDQSTADERIPLLHQTPAAVRWISAEPLLGPVDIGPWLSVQLSLASEDPRSFSRIDWLVVGGESGPDARPMNPDWVRSLRDQCVAAGVAFFFKQWGAWAPSMAEVRKYVTDRIDVGNGTVVSRVGKKAAGRELDGRTWDEYPALLASKT